MTHTPHTAPGGSSSQAPANCGGLILWSPPLFHSRLTGFRCRGVSWFFRAGDGHQCVIFPQPPASIPGLAVGGGLL